MIKMFIGVLAFFFLDAPAQAADKIRISMTGFAGQFMTFPLAQKRGFLKEEGIEAEIIRISAAAGRAALTDGEVDYSTGIGGTAIGGALSAGFRSVLSPALCPHRCSALVARPEYQNCSVAQRQDYRDSYPGGVAHFAARAIAGISVSMPKRK